MSLVTSLALYVSHPWLVPAPEGVECAAELEVGVRRLVLGVEFVDGHLGISAAKDTRITRATSHANEKGRVGCDRVSGG